MPTLRDTVVRPLITEKSSAAYQTRKEYAFEVHPEANKYQIREALDGLAAELAAARFRAGAASDADAAAIKSCLAEGARLGTAPVGRFIDADVAFHSALHVLSGNAAISETVAEQWPHFRRSMGLVLATPDMRARVWVEHGQIVDAVFAGDASEAGRRARRHTAAAGEDTARRLEDGNAMTR